MEQANFKKFVITSIITSLLACILIGYAYYDYTVSAYTRYKVVNEVKSSNGNNSYQKPNVKIDAQTGASY